MNDDDTVEDIEELLRQARAQRGGEPLLSEGADTADGGAREPSGPADDETIAADDRLFVGGQGGARPQ